MAEGHIALENLQSSSEIFRRFIAALNRGGQGVLPEHDEQLEVVESGTPAMSVVVEPGSALVGSGDEVGFYTNTTDKTLSISSNSSGSTRYDYIVIEIDLSQSAGNDTLEAKVVEGTPGAGIPSLTQTSSVYQLGLATVVVVNGETAITDSEITDTRSFITALQPDETVIRKTANESVVASVTLQDDDDFSFSVDADASYIIHATFSGNIPSTPDIKLLFDGPSGMYYDGLITNHYGSGAETGLMTEVAAKSVLGEDSVVKVFTMDIILVTVGNAGTVQLQWACNTGSGTITLYADSYMTVRKIEP